MRMMEEKQSSNIFIKMSICAPMPWRNGIMAAPGIGINLISNRSAMYSSHYQYDDIPSVLLFISVIVSINQIPFQSIWKKIKRKKAINS